MNKCFFVLAGLLLANVCFSQRNAGTYNWGIGAKYQPSAISIKKYFKKGDAVEMLFSKYDEGYRATMLLELSPAILFNNRSLRMVLGPGFHTSVREDKYVVRHENNATFGMDGIIGLEWKIPKIPIAIQVDYQPSVDMVGNDDFYKNWGGATIRLAF